jgi:hypothetical protein
MHWGARLVVVLVAPPRFEGWPFYLPGVNQTTLSSREQSLSRVEGRTAHHRLAAHLHRPPITVTRATVVDEAAVGKRAAPLCGSANPPPPHHILAINSILNLIWTGDPQGRLPCGTPILDMETVRETGRPGERDRGRSSERHGESSTCSSPVLPVTSLRAGE